MTNLRSFKVNSTPWTFSVNLLNLLTRNFFNEYKKLRYKYIKLLNDICFGKGTVYDIAACNDSTQDSYFESKLIYNSIKIIICELINYNYNDDDDEINNYDNHLHKIATKLSEVLTFKKQFCKFI